jgi:hypothetical protein
MSGGRPLPRKRLLPLPAIMAWSEFVILLDYGGRMGAGDQTAVSDIDGDGDLDIVSAGKAGLHLAENLTKSPHVGKFKRNCCSTK